MKLAIAVLLATASFAATAGLPSSDQDFVTTAGQGGLAEVALGHLASQQGTSAAVKSFGTQMVADHGKGNASLKAAAEKAGATVPGAPSEDQRAAMTKLKGLKGAEFDKEYADAMVKDHKDTIALFEKEASKGDNGPVKTFAATTLPTLKHHLQMAEELQKQTK